MEQLYFTPKPDAKDFMDELRGKYPLVSISKLVRAVFAVGQSRAQAEPKALQEALQLDSRRIP